MKNVLLTLFAFLLFSFQSFGSHLVGSEITYKRISGKKYEVTLVKYRLCSGNAFTGTDDILVSCPAGGPASPLTKTISRVSIQTIKLKCDTITTDCNPQNTPIAGSSGLEKHIYRDTFDFDAYPYSTLANCSGNIRFSISECCRISAINTGPANTNHYNFAEVNLSMGNNSVDLTTDLNFKGCCNQPKYYNVGARDTSERDSISYAWATPLISSSLSAGYSGINYGYDQPFNAYYPGSLSPPFNLPNADPPIGINLNPLTGDLIYTPTSCNEFTCYVIEITEWRKDTSGTYKIVGKTRRDESSITTICSDNNPPKINGPHSYVACVGEEICFDISATDRVFVPPPPASASAPDTIELSWNQGIVGASFTILNDTTPNKTAKFCWTPPMGSVSTLPYTFTASVHDNHCDNISKVSRAFTITVKNPTEAAITTVAQNCGWTKISSQVDTSNFSGTPIYSWELLDTNSVPVKDFRIAYFQSTGSFSSTAQQDSLKIQKDGTYILKHTIENSPLLCPTVYYDTITFQGLTTATINFDDDSVVCKNSDIVLTTTTNDTSGISYQWFQSGVLLTGETNDSLSLPNFNVTKIIRVETTTAAGCTSFDEVFILFVPSLPFTLPSLLPKYEACSGDTVAMRLYLAKSDILWTNGATTAVNRVSESMDLRVTFKDDYGCEHQDSTSVVIRPIPTSNLKDSTICDMKTVFYAGPFATYLWSTGASTSSIIPSSSGNYWVEVSDTFGCTNTDSAFLDLKSKPIFSLGNDTSFCGDSIVISTNVGSQYLWNTGETTNTETATSSGNYWLKVTGFNGCSSTDTIAIDINNNPNTPVLTSSGTTITSNQNGTHKWFKNGVLETSFNQRTLTITGVGNYTAIFIDNNGCESDTSNTISKTLGINMVNSRSIKVYPNPASGSAVVDFVGFSISEIKSINLYDVNGKLLNLNYDIEDGKVLLDWHSTSEVLFLEVRTSDFVTRKRIVNIH